MSRLPVVLALLAAGAPLLAGCESTQHKSQRLRAKGIDRLHEAKGLVVTKPNPDVKVLSTASLRDENGAAVVVRIRNVGKSALAQLPVSVELDDAHGKSLYRNDAPGLETSLVQAALLAPGEEMWWVNDQVVTAGKPEKVKALVGEAKPATEPEPKIKLTGARVVVDPVDGVAVKGKASTDVEQRKLVIHCVASKHGRVVAAGRSIIERLKPGKPVAFTIFFIGDPRGAKLTLAAPPTTLGRS
jgi:hypothetical protein